MGSSNFSSLKHAWIAQLLLFFTSVFAIANASAELFFVHTDHLGTPKVVTDANQAVVWQGSATPFGETDVTVEALTQDARFPGQYFDAESGLNYNYFRDYDPSLGRYIQSDPIGLQGGLNTYAYVGGNPLMYTDPYGLNPAVWTGRGAWAAGGAIARSPWGKRVTLATLDAVIEWNESVNDGNDSDDGGQCPDTAPDIDDFDDPNNLPDGWRWHPDSRGEPGSREGAYHNPSTGESLHDDRSHPPGKNPHITYTDPTGKRWDNFGNGYKSQ